MMALFLCRLSYAESSDSGALRIPELTDMTADDRPWEALLQQVLCELELESQVRHLWPRSPEPYMEEPCLP